MPIVCFPTTLKYYVENHSEMEISATSVVGLLDALVTRFPSLRFHLLDSDGKLRRHFNIFVNGENIRELNGVDTILKSEDRVLLLASAAGG